MKRLKILSVLLALVLSLCLALSACGTDNAGGGNNSGGTNNGGGNSNQTEDYESTGEYHTVTFDSQDGSAVQSQSVLDGDYATQPDEPEKDGKVFLYWSDTIEGERFLFSAHKITADITLYAVWSDYHTVTFDSRGGSDVDMQQVADGGYARQPGRPEKAGSYFLHWSEEIDGKERFLFTSRKITEDITLYAVWGTAYTVTFDTQGGSAIPAQYVSPDTSARNPDSPKREGYNFLGWYTEATGGVEWHWNDPVRGNITVYAHWEEVGETSATASLEYEYDGALGGYVVTGVGQETDIRIPAEYRGSAVVGIADRAFRGKDIVSVSFPATIKSIGMNAFTGCEKLTSVTIPAAVTELENYAFSDCSSLTEVTFEEGSRLATIGNRAFAGTTSLKTLTLPANITSIGSYLIRDSGVTTIHFLGTKAQWDEVEKASNWNYGKTDIEITCSNDSNA